MSLFTKELIPKFVDLLPISLIILNKNGECTYTNQSFERLMGLAFRQLQDHNWLRWVSIEDQSKIRVLLSGEIIELCLVTITGTVSVKITPISAFNEQFCFTVELINNQQSYKNADLLQKIMDCTEAVLYSVDMQGKITAFNHAAYLAIMNRKGVAIHVGDYWPEIISGSSGLEKQRMETLLNYVLTGKNYNTTEDLLTEEAEIITYSVRASPIINENNQVIGAVLCAHNITVETRLQREAAQKSKLRTMELERWNQFYDALLAILTHDLRQPLAAIIMNAEIITDGSRELSILEIKEIMSILESISKKSIDLLEGILYWVKSKKQDFSYKPTALNLSHLIYMSNALFVQDQEKKNIIFSNDVSEGLIMYGHPQMMLFVCRSLISNATKYAFPNSIIRVSAEVSEGNLTMVVQDNGEGMSAEKMANLFTIQEDSFGGDKYKGAGISLTIAQELVAEMNGRIWAESEVGKGTIFYLCFPSC